jgi:hypothetical protein
MSLSSDCAAGQRMSMKGQVSQPLKLDGPHLPLHTAGQLVKQLRIGGQLLEEGGRHRRQLPQHLRRVSRQEYTKQRGFSWKVCSA